MISPLLICGSALILVALERLFPYHRGQRLFRAGLATDLLFYGLLQGYAIALLVKWALGWVHSTPTLVSGWSITTQVLFFSLFHELYIYCFHRWQHSNRFLFRLHEIHHAAAELDWIATSRTHALELTINQMVVNAPMLILGASPEVAMIRGVIDAVWGMYIHSNIDVRSGVLRLIFNGPELHRWHHSAAPGRGVNFGTKLAIWDWLFGTAWYPEAIKPAAYGLWEVESYPNNYLKQTLHAFRPFDRRDPC